MDEYTIHFLSSAAREFRSLPANVKSRVAEAVDRLGQNPGPGGVRKLVGHDQLYRIRVGQYRVVYQIDDDMRIVRVTRIRHRRDAYR